MVKTIKNVLNYGIDKLKENIIDTFLIDAKVLLCYVLECDKSYLLINKDSIIDDISYNKYIELIEKRCNKMPVKYITGICEFYSLDFYVNEAVLIPRPDTEIIIDKAVSLIDKNKEIKILDLCTGSGCIGITLATIFNKSDVCLIDISKDALNVAKKNVLKYNLENRVKLINKDILKETVDEKFDLIVSNPPYINEKDYSKLDYDVKNYEPKIALLSSIDEYKFYKRIIDFYSKALKDDGIMLLEMGYNQSDYLYNYAIASGNFSKIEIVKDLASIDRVLYLKK